MRPEGTADHVTLFLPAYANGTLERAVRARVEAHLIHCAACQIEMAAWLAIGDATRAALLDRLPTTRVLEGALARIAERGECVSGASASVRATPTLAGASPARRISIAREIARMIRIARRQIPGLAWAGVAAAVLVGIVVFTPVGSYAQDFITIFQPRQIAAVPVSVDELKTLPDLTDYGTLVEPARVEPRKVASAADAAAAAGIPVLVPATLPSGLPTAPSYSVWPGRTASFTFSAAKARAAAAAHGKALPPMPPNIDGSTIQVTTGPVVLITYGAADEQDARQLAEAARRDGAGRNSAAGPVLIIGQTTAPVVTSTGVSATELENYLLAQPGISPQLASAIRALGDPSTTLPIPVPVDRAISHPVQVQGVTGLAVADSTGLGGYIIWQKDGRVTGVAGTFTESELLAVANSLH
jgi:hypothetical protein